MSRATVVVGSCLLSATLSAQVQWRRVDVAAPGALAGEQIVGDAARGVTMLFGGQALPAATPYHLLVWNGVQWATPAPGSGPQPLGRVGHALAYDRARGKVVLFGGVCLGACGVASGTVLLDDTWEYDGSWTAVTTAHRPSARHGAAIAFDEVRGRTVLFGGRNALGSHFAETWEYDGVDWHPSSPLVQPPSDGPMAFDVGRGRCIVVTNAQSWAWDGGEWVASGPPAPQFASALAFDRRRNRLVLYSPSYTEPWEWDGAAWQQRAVTAPMPDVSFAMTYDDARAQTVWISTLDFGTPTFRDTWVYEPVVAAALARFGAACGSPTSAPDLHAVGSSLAWLDGQFEVEVTGIDPNSPLALLAIGRAAAQPTDLAAYGWPGCFLYLDVDWFETMTLGAGAANWSAVVPASPALLGAQFGLQAAVLDGAATGGVVTTNGLAGVIGGR